MIKVVAICPKCEKFKIINETYSMGTPVYCSHSPKEIYYENVPEEKEGCKLVPEKIACKVIIL